ncbi:hypothetical protein J2T56_002791 [Natronobacillus azotifigens]|uniref:Uncharacterized protein n=1 Tax=Natronobacillus azotifigens TaxID=472978 RepID=A0A9J6RGX7_9BACI|nr:hypothetical protein [Natronobacillus azotifigens]MCZ0704393.1 hypothetical protein [Natronobacillus azotifigens]
MIKLKFYYISVSFVLPFILITILKTAINVDRPIDMIIGGLLFIIFSKLFTKPFEKWIVTNNKEDQLWDWAFDDGLSFERGNLYAIFLIASIVVEVNPM